eukprot:SAG22_NODE_5182_length_1068_cov_1.867905_2_plen_206_part_00
MDGMVHSGCMAPPLNLHMAPRTAAISTPPLLLLRLLLLLLLLLLAQLQARALSQRGAGGGGDSAGGCPSRPITALLFKALNLSYPGLEAVQAAVAAGDRGAACNALAAYYAAPKHAPWLRHAAPAVGTALAGGAVDATMLNDTYDFYGEVGKVPRNPDGGLDWYNRGPVDDDEFMFALNRMVAWEQFLGAWLSTGNPQYAPLTFH